MSSFSVLLMEFYEHWSDMVSTSKSDLAAKGRWGVSVFPIFHFFPGAWSDAEQESLRHSYAAGLNVRVSDPVFWKKVFVAMVVVAVLQEVLVFFGYYFSLWSHSINRKD